MKPKNQGKDWTESEVLKLKALASSNTTTKEIANKLQRTVNSVYNKASEENISLKPKD